MSERWDWMQKMNDRSYAQRQQCVSGAGMVGLRRKGNA